MPKETRISTVIGLVFLILIVTASLYGQDKTYASIDLAKSQSLEGAWKASATAENRTFRALTAASRGTINITTWWKKGLRPPEGKAFRIEIEFKDTAQAPVMVDIYAGLPNWRRAHRIGGHGDGQWKTAHIPLPWDMVMRIPGTDHTALALSAPAGADIPVQSLKIVEGAPRRDEWRWAAETRAWVARVQSEKRKKVKRGISEQAVLPAPLDSQRAVPFVRSWMRPIQLTSAPVENETNIPLRIRTTRNEVESAQFGIHAPAGNLLGCTVDIAPDGLRDKRGKVLKAEIELLAAEYAVNSGNYLLAQRLWPAFPVDLHKGESRMFLLRLKTLGKASRPGTYYGKIAIRAEALETDLPVEVEVLPITLMTMEETGFRQALCADKLLPRHEMEYMVNHNMVGLCFFTYALPIELKKRSRTNFDIDFTVADDFMANAGQAGISSVVYYMGGDPYGFPDTLQLERELYRRVYYEGTDMMAGRIELMKKIAAAPDRLVPETRENYKQWVRKFMAHAEKKGWPEIFLSPFDEPAKWSQGGWGDADFFIYKDPKTGWDALPHIRKGEVEEWLKKMKAQGVEPEFICSGGAGEWIKGYFKDACAAIHEAWPKARIYGSIHHAKPGLVFKDDIEIFSSDAIHEDREMGPKVGAATDPRKEYWLYDFSRDAGDPANMRYVFGFFHSAFDTTGALCWAYNWDGDFDSSSSGPSLFGNTTPYGVAIQPDFEGFREAWDDRRYIETLKKAAAARGKSKELAAFLKQFNLKAGRKRAEGKWDNVEILYRETGDRNALDTMRNEIIEKILKLK
ncbi:hypothetical protein ACFL4W_00460 [Planctomycetota bacterium]